MTHTLFEFVGCSLEVGEWKTFQLYDFNGFMEKRAIQFYGLGFHVISPMMTVFFW
jgi:hypothetical protein